MKIGEARQIYSGQLKRLREQQRELINRQKKLQQNQKINNKIIQGSSDEQTEEAAKSEEGDTLELSIEALQEHIDKTQEFMDKLMAISNGIHDAEAARQQNEAAKKYADDVVKCMEVARRIAKGDRVPAYDEEKLMEYSMELYMSAKNLAVMNQQKEHKKHKSLWEEEEEKAKEPCPSERADQTELSINTPDIVEVIEIEGDAKF